MADASIEALGEGRYRVVGELSFHTVTPLLRDSQALFQGSDASLELDLGAVTRADSAGLALLIEWLRVARAAGKGIRFQGAPPQMRAIAQVSDLESILPL